jgi:His/Glu/Gln/Arg/opine family amino acid ABC transporter permease subunit
MGTLVWACFTTLKVAIIALGMGLCLGILLGLAMHQRNHPVWRALAIGTSIFLRGIPELLLLFLLYYGGNALLKNLHPHAQGLSPFWAGALGLALIFAGYAAQIISAALKAIPLGQFESSRAMGFNRYQCLIHVIFPQIWQHALPGLGNLWQILLKDTALVSVLGLSEMMQWAKFEANITHAPFTYFMTVSLVYFTLSSLSQLGLSYQQRSIERKLQAKHV